MSEYEKRLEDPCWQRHQELDDDFFVDAEGLQLDMFGKPDLSKDFIMKSIYY